MNSFHRNLRDCCCCLVAHLSLTLVTPLTTAHQAPLPMGFPRLEYWSGVAFLPQGDLLDPGVNPHLLRLLHWQADSLPLSHLGSTDQYYYYLKGLFGLSDNVQVLKHA